ncbi:hypothetical protein T265_03929 [Opisthorchis viverrini]|uniref:RRM domain-containing protein n=1 Tax=Opisthorchis viverrini TaxID=6198 RepID=A0A074ZPW3_OPIVI|nr:hypothetical protein T265_03929 [Opisthorchis viverrini]KER29463.1 hypothetical protein T265_03929 [Opisthorchis viverrini]
MNGEIDIISHPSIRKMFMGSNSCTSQHSTLSVQLPVVDSTIFPSLNDCVDYECSSSGILSAGSDPACDENTEGYRNGSDCERLVSKDTICNRLTPSNSSQLSPLNSSTECSGDILPMTESGVVTGSSGFDNTPGSQSFPTSTAAPAGYHMDVQEKKMFPNVNRLAEAKVQDQSNCPTDDSNIFCGDVTFLQQSLNPNTASNESQNDLLLEHSDVSNLHASQLHMDSRVPRLDRDMCNFPMGLTKSINKTLPLFVSGDSENPSADREHGFPSTGLWGRPTTVGTTAEDLRSFGYTGDSVASLASNGLVEHSSTGVENGSNAGSQNLMSAVAAAAAKRAITGGHQSAKFGAVSRPSTWTESSLSTAPQSSFGSLGSNSWNMGHTNTTKVGANGLGGICQPVASGVSPIGSSPTPWAQVVTQQQPPHGKTNNVNNVLGNMGLASSVSGGNCSIRTSVNVGGISTAPSFYTNNTCKTGIGNSVAANMYSMFPKKPQHRMMAHWQQQQQHHHPGLQHSHLNKIPGGLQNTTGQPVSGGRIPTACLDGSTVGLIGSASGDCSTVVNYPSNFNSGGCSVLHSLSSTIATPPTMNTLSIGSSGDSFASVASSITTANNDNASLDTFKFGLDQQLMEVIKSFETTNIGNTNSGGANTNNNNDGSVLVGGLDDVVIPSFNEVDQQFPNMTNLNQLSVLSQAVSSTNTPSLCGINGANNHAPSIRNLSGPSVFGTIGMNNPYSVFANIPTREEGYSRKVFVGGLPPDIDEEEITTAFRRFGPLIVDWPHKTESKAYFPPKGYCFLLFQDERSVQSLINACIVDENKYYWCVSSPTMKDKPVQIRPWNLADSDFVMDGSQPLDPRKTIFVGGVPRPLRAIELALIMDRLYSGVCYAGIDTDPELKYPKGAGRVAFSNQQSYIAAISARFVQLQHNEIDKRVEVKPYVLDNQMCDECQGARCGGKFAPFFCANVACLQYYCEQCWVQIHSRNGREYHKPLVKEGAERPRPALYRW